jgi:HAD superfamily hydrolase (TIGR01509 family)
MKFKGAIFDMDGTIIDSLMFWDSLWKSIGETYMNDASFKPSDEVNKKVRTMIYTDAMAYFKECYNIPESTENFVRFTSEGLNDFYKNTAKAKDGAKELLSYLKKQNVTLCLASASAMPQVKYVLQYHGLLEYFDFVLSCADIGVGKERPDIYLLAKDRMGFKPEEICVFEDSFVALETAKNAGFQTVGVFDQYSPGQERLKNAADVYLDKTQNLRDLITE